MLIRKSPDNWMNQHRSSYNNKKKKEKKNILNKSPEIQRSF
jgi:hypothetical protein